MRVAYITNRAVGTDGWGRYTVEVIKSCRALGIEPVLISAYQDIDPALAEIEHYPILHPVLTKRFTTFRTLRQIPALRRILQTCDAVQCCVELYAPLVALARPPEVAFFLNAHGTWAIRPLESPLSRLLFAPAIRSADVVLCLSHFTQRWMSRLIDLPRAEILSGGVIPADWQREVQVKLPDWTQGNRIALTATAVKTRKGQHTVVEAIALARQHLPDLHYAIVGNANEKTAYVQQLKARIQALNLTDYVHFTGIVSQEELVAWMQRGDVFVQPSVNDGSSFEGLGLVYLEAGAAGTPSIGSFNCGAEDAIIDGATGLLVPQNDPEATAAALIKMLSDPVLRQQMGEAARQQAERMSWANLAKRLVALYQEVTTQRGKRG